MQIHAQLKVYLHYSEVHTHAVAIAAALPLIGRGKILGRKRGLFQRLTVSLSGRGAITTNNVSLSSSSFCSSTFTLFGDTSGGPPTTYTWTRNGQVITNSSSYSISIQLNEDIMDEYTRFQDSHYRSTLTVTGRLPGVYQYSVTNRATPSTVTGYYLNCAEPIISAPSLTAMSVTISWTQPKFNLLVVGYTVTATRHTGSSQVLCPSFVEEDHSTTTSPSVTTTTFTGLQEFSRYTVRVTANFSPAFGLSSTLIATGSIAFTTLTSGKPQHTIIYAWVVY